MNTRTLTPSEVEFEIILHEEHDHPRDHFQFDEDVQWVLNQIEYGNPWGWCCVEVRATYESFTGSDFLGGCAYLNEKDFKQEGGYYQDMCSIALDELNKHIQSIADVLPI